LGFHRLKRVCCQFPRSLGSVVGLAFMHSDLEKIGDIIWDSIEKMGFKPKLLRQSAILCWGEVAGEAIAQKSKALKVEGDTLIVKVYQPAWRQELLFLKNNLLAKIEAKIGKGHISDIRFV
jgi:predicted nucleic acid-binding Zn ribbon protein